MGEVATGVVLIVASAPFTHALHGFGKAEVEAAFAGKK
jgi:hypothetical protein